MWEAYDADNADNADNADDAALANDMPAADAPRLPANDDDSAELPDASDVADETFAELLASLRALPGPCAPPVGEGAFDILYASAREIVVWFISAHEGAAQREVVIPARLARRAWGMLLRGAPVDEVSLQALAAGAAGGRWLLALFAQLPGVEVRAPASDDGSTPGQTVTLCWRGEAEDPQPTTHASDDAPAANGGAA